MKDEKKSDNSTDYFTKLMIGTSEDKQSLELQQDFSQVLTLMLFKLIEKVVNKMDEDGKHSDLKKYVEKFPDQVTEAWLFRINEFAKKELEEFKGYSSSSLGGMFNGMFDVEKRVKEYKEKAEKLAEVFKTSMKAGR